MTKFEFSHKLRKALSGRVSHTVVNENVAYYENYIDTEIRKGRREEEVLEELGDPRLLAKTIVDTAGEDAGMYPEEDKGCKNSFGKTIRIPFWLSMILLLLIMLVVFKVVGIVLAALLPIVIPVLLIYWMIRYFRNR